jgi:hypothetical protein
VSGVAATGAPISGRVFLKDAAGQERFVDTTDGSYSFSLAGLTGPFMLKAQWTVNNQPQTLYSIAQQPGTANITPLTQVIVMAAARTTSLDSLYGNPGQGLASVATAVPAAVSEVQGTLNPLLTSFSQSGVNPITGVFSANHTGMDALLDSVTVSASGGNISVANAIGGSLILQAPVTHVANGLAIPNWTDQDALIGYHPDVAVDASGRGLAAWTEEATHPYALRARFLDGSGASPVTVNAGDGGDAQNPRVAFDGYGNAIMVWEHYQNSRQTIWSSRYTASTHTWSTPRQISGSTPAADAAGPSIAVDNAGNAIAVWSEGDGTNNHFDIWCARYDVTQNTWTAAAIISDTNFSAYQAQVKVNAVGQGLVGWVQENVNGVSNAPVDLWARSVTTTSTPSGWGAQVRVNAVVGSSSRWLDAYFSLAMDANGNGGALWVQNAGLAGPSEINWAMYSATGGWQTSSVIPSASGSGFRFPMFAFDGTGNAFAVWREFVGNSVVVGSAARYTAGSGWGTIVPFSSNAQGNVMDPRLAVDGVGNATIVWYEFRQLTNSFAVPVKSIRYLIDTGWGSESQLSAAGNMDGIMICPAPRVAANPSGQTLMIWGYSDNTC